MFCKKGVLRNSAKFTGKHLCQSLYFNKVAGFRPVTLLKKRLWHRCFPVNFAKFLRTPFFTEHLRWLPLKLFASSLYIFRIFIWRKTFSWELWEIFRKKKLNWNHVLTADFVIQTPIIIIFGLMLISS